MKKSVNIEKCKNLRLFGEVNYAIIANQDMCNFVAQNPFRPMVFPFIFY